MEHTIAHVELIRPWRRATFLVAAVAAVELVLLVVLGASVLGGRVADGVRAAASERVLAPTPSARPRRALVGVPKLARDETSVLVLNGNGRSGAASDAAASLQALGYIVGGVGNAPRSDYTRSLVMFRPGFRPEAVRLAKDFRVRVVAPLDGMRPAELMGAHAAVILGG